MNATSNALIECTAWMSQNAANLFVQSTVLISIGLLAATILRKRGSAVQSAIYRATLIVVLVCPLATILLDQLGINGWSIPMPDTTRSVMVAENLPSDPPSLPVEPPPISFDSSRSISTKPALPSPGERNLDPESSPVFLLPENTAGTVEPPRSSEPQVVIKPKMIEQVVPNTAWVLVYTLAGLIWMFGVAVFLVRLTRAYRKLSLMRRQSLQVPESEQMLCRKLATSINVRTPDVRRNSLLFSPCLTGVVSPMILLPAEIREPVPLEKAFAHELAHLRRHDTLWNLIQRIALALFFFQPLLWRLVYRLETTAEEVCDDYVVRHCLDRTGYAQQLVDLAESNLLAPNMAGLGMFNSKSILGHRVVRILDSTRILTTQISFPMIASIVALAIACATLGGFLGNASKPAIPDPAIETSDKSSQVAAGELIDIGTIDVSKQDRPEPVRTRLDAGADATNNIEDPETNEGTGRVDEQGAATERVIEGTVSDGDGQPIANATVRFNSWNSHPNYELTTLAETQSDSSGHFELKVDEQEFHRLNPPEYSKVRAGVIVQAEGFGGTQKLWSEISENESLTISLTTENVISGRVVDLEGNPVVGAKVHFTYARELGEQMADSFLESLQQTGTFSTARDVYLHQQCPEINPSTGTVAPVVETNQQGEFEINGIPRDSLVNLRIEHPQIVTHLIEVLARSMDAVDADPNYKVFGDRPLVVTQPCRPIVGQIVDSKTGTPIAGATVFCSEMGIRNTVFWSSAAPRAIADDQGRFELLGVPKSDGTRLVAYPPNDMPYLIRQIRNLPDTVGLNPVEMTIELHRGIWIAGQVTDSQTGEGVVGEIVYLPMKDNPFLAGVRGYQTGHSLGYEDFLQQFRTDENGHFRIVGLPGQAVLGARVDSQEYRMCAGYEKLLEELGSTYSKDRIEDARMVGTDLQGAKFLDTHFRSFTWRNNLGSSFTGIEPPEGVDEVVQNIQMDAGLEMTIRVIATDGNPVDRFEVSGFDGFYGKREFTRGTATLTRIGNDEKRRIWIRGIDRPIGAIVEVHGAHRDPSLPLEFRTVALEPFGTIRGRLIDKDNKPLANYSVDASYGGEATTSENGEFEIGEMFAGQKFSIQITGPGETEFRVFAPNLEMGPGQTLELGNVNVDDLGGMIISGLAG